MSSASGHHKISEIGEKVLKQALKDANKGKDFDLGAFYLGNWLTDFSQAIDPVAYKNIENMINDTLSEAEPFTDGISDVFDDVEEELDALAQVAREVQANKTGIDYFDRIIEKIVTEVGAGVERLADADFIDAYSSNIRSVIPDLKKDVSSLFSTANIVDPTNNAHGDPNLVRAVKATIAFIGYPKFVIEDLTTGSANVSTKMAPEVYDEILKQRITQYFPHEHLDRPDTAEYSPNGVTNYTKEVAQNPLSKYSAVNPEDNHLYQYLRDDISLTAGLLADIDKHWASATFSATSTHFIDPKGNPQKIDDKNIQWNLKLAELGHALHAIEDFFAHSNFIEHAAKVEPGAFESMRLLEPRYDQQLQKRLKEWPGPGYNLISDQGNWENLPNEPHIATGYFDFVDTFHSLTIMAEGLFGLSHELLGDHAEDAHDTAKSAVEYEYQELLVDSLEFFSHPMDVYKAHKDGTKNKALETLGDTDVVKDIAVLTEFDSKDELDKRSQKIETMVEQIIALSPLFNNAPDFLIDNYKTAVIIWVKVSAGRSLYSTFKSVVTFFTNPVKWIKDKLPKAITSFLGNLLEAYVQTTLHQIAGGDRIGCHTLIAKDHGHELFHDSAMACSQAVHWYVLNQITRHSRPRIAFATRNTVADDGFNLIAISPWVDWLETLEYFLSHPASKQNGPLIETEEAITIDIEHVIDPADNVNSLLTLAEHYKNNFYVDEASRKIHTDIPSELTWEVIAKYNFPTTKQLSGNELKLEINRILTLQGTSYTIDSIGNQAFKKGTRVIIPFQRMNKTQYKSTPGVDHWWYHVIRSKEDDKWSTFEKWSTDQTRVISKSGQQIAPHKHHPVPISQAYLEELDSSADQLRIEMELAYNRLA
ncbi:hypothetical protein A9Q99_25705 [Gammaproteobacteria bacterium 45_16_T64]|nr:hypothetical protein A9Q99_25705 [Gammaproteobacteria bacterium 45_16_T64]